MNSIVNYVEIEVINKLYGKEWKLSHKFYPLEIRDFIKMGQKEEIKNS
jgi:hypothetical protein